VLLLYTVELQSNGEGSMYEVAVVYSCINNIIGFREVGKTLKVVIIEVGQQRA
jgi:hypothetical protein